MIAHFTLGGAKSLPGARTLVEQQQIAFSYMRRLPIFQSFLRVPRVFSDTRPVEYRVSRSPAHPPSDKIIAGCGTYNYESTPIPSSFPIFVVVVAALPPHLRVIFQSFPHSRSTETPEPHTLAGQRKNRSRRKIGLRKL